MKRACLYSLARRSTGENWSSGVITGICPADLRLDNKSLALPVTITHSDVHATVTVNYTFMQRSQVTCGIEDVGTVPVTGNYTA